MVGTPVHDMQTKYGDFVAGGSIQSNWGDDVNVTLDDKISQTNTVLQQLASELRSHDEIISGSYECPLISGAWETTHGVVFGSVVGYNYLSFDVAGDYTNYKSAIPIANSIDSARTIHRGKIRICMGVQTTGIDTIKFNFWLWSNVGGIAIISSNEDSQSPNITIQGGVGKVLLESNWINFQNLPSLAYNEVMAVAPQIEYDTDNNWGELQIFAVSVILASDPAP